MRHCWMSRYEYMQSIGQELDYLADPGPVPQTCMLQANHDGPHEWTDNDKILLRWK